jgi:hypothetical protein
MHAKDSGARDCRQMEDRRKDDDRRSGCDRRGDGATAGLSGQPRAFGFRSFEERRASQDRRLYAADGQPWDRRKCDTPRSQLPAPPEATLSPETALPAPAPAAATATRPAGTLVQLSDDAWRALLARSDH